MARKINNRTWFSKKNQKPAEPSRKEINDAVNDFLKRGGKIKRVELDYAEYMKQSTFGSLGSADDYLMNQ